MVKISELKDREVINVVDGRRLGVICDLELDLEEGVIKAIVVPGTGKIFGLFGGDRDYIIPWRNIIKIGIDTILVELEEIPFARE
ncbi:MAG TPA: YlmC/YmxH family sporulation protein [Firmicutes bacterium]|nr:YlmC/YmxH family sporulation protein [Bacillota bacterium]